METDNQFEIFGSNWIMQQGNLSDYASERSTFSFTGVAESDNESGMLSSDGWDSCFATACRTRFWTSDDDGDVGNPIPFVSNFPAAHVNAWAPTFTGASNNL